VLVCDLSSLCAPFQSNRDKLLACPLGVCRELAGRAVSASGPQLCISHVGIGAFGKATMTEGRERPFVTQPGSADDLLYNTVEMNQVSGGA
jgi:hypothetical protein